LLTYTLVLVVDVVYKFTLVFLGECKLAVLYRNISQQSHTFGGFHVGVSFLFGKPSV